MVANLSQTNIQLASALSYWQKHYQMQDALPQDSMELLGGVDLGALSFQESVLDNEPMNTRAGLYVYLNAMVRSYISILTRVVQRFVPDCCSSVSDPYSMI